MDSRIRKLAHSLVNYSVELKPGERLWINAGDGRYMDDMLRALVDEAVAVGAMPFVQMPTPAVVQRAILASTTPERAELQAKWDAVRFQDINAYIVFAGSPNLHNFKDTPSEVMKTIGKARRELNDHIVNNTKWISMRWPNDSMAQAAEMPTELFEDFYFDVCTLDYEKMDRAMEPLKQLMERTDKVRIVGPGDTDLTFSIKGIGAVKCSGKYNVPDGECYTAPVCDSVNGVMHYNTSSLYQGFLYKDVRLVFKDGKIVEATANDTERINQVFDTDEGARYVGEFSLGFNPYILHPMLDTLFDEKIAGSLHFTPGRAYEDESNNGNKSNIHWDMVLIQRPEYGGGAVYFDDRLIRKDGRFVVPELEGLNPENLVG